MPSSHPLGILIWMGCNLGIRLLKTLQVILTWSLGATSRNNSQVAHHFGKSGLWRADQCSSALSFSTASSIPLPLASLIWKLPGTFAKLVWFGFCFSFLHEHINTSHTQWICLVLGRSVYSFWTVVSSPYSKAVMQYLLTAIYHSWHWKQWHNSNWLRFSLWPPGLIVYKVVEKDTNNYNIWEIMVSCDEHKKATKY